MPRRQQSPSPDKLAAKLEKAQKGDNQPPKFRNQSHQDYHREFWRLYLENEHLLQDITQAASSNHQTQKKILRIENFYDERMIQQIIQKQKSLLLPKKLKNGAIRLVSGERKENCQPVQESMQRRMYLGTKNSNQPRSKAKNDARKKHNRRTAQEIERD